MVCGRRDRHGWAGQGGAGGAGAPAGDARRRHEAALRQPHRRCAPRIGLRAAANPVLQRNLCGDPHTQADGEVASKAVQTADGLAEHQLQQAKVTGVIGRFRQPGESVFRALSTVHVHSPFLISTLATTEVLFITLAPSQLFTARIVVMVGLPPVPVMRCPSG